MVRQGWSDWIGSKQIDEEERDLRGCLPRTVRKALEVLMGMVKSEHVYWPSSDRVTSLMLMVSSFHDALTSSIRLSRNATKQTTKHESVNESQRFTVWIKFIVNNNTVISSICHKCIYRCTAQLNSCFFTYTTLFGCWGYSVGSLAAYKKFNLNHKSSCW